MRGNSSIAYSPWDGRFPVYAPVVALLWRLSERQPGDTAQLCATISSDPGLCGAVLTAANTVRAVLSIDEAIELMGTEAATAIALSAALDPFPDTRGCSAADRTRRWRRALTGRMMAETLASETGMALPRIAATAGLMHDIAGVVLYQDDNAAASCRLLEDAGWPFRITEAIRLQPYPPSAEAAPDLRVCLYLSRRLM
ncbi:MAG: HDOD domain-containing protein [candidate division Zixibacteria bacterium]|nr:HDOD domain-containing protein [candidate division Zixibacteria bacterium]